MHVMTSRCVDWLVCVMQNSSKSKKYESTRFESLSSQADRYQGSLVLLLFLKLLYLGWFLECQYM